MTKASDEQFGAELTKAMSVLRPRAMQLTRNATDASDLVQDTLLKAWQARDRFEPGTNLNAWLMCIMRNQHLSGLRVKGRETPAGVSDYADGLLTRPSQEWALAAKQVGQTMADLPPNHFSALVLVGALGTSYGEASASLGCPEGTIKSRVSRARQELRERTHLDQMFIREDRLAS